MDPTLLQDNFTRMMFRDAARDDLPPGAVWNSVDFLPDLGAPLRKRGGWSYWSTDPGVGTYYVAGAYAPFSGGVASPQLVGIQDDGKVIKLDSGSSTNKGTAVAPIDKPRWWRDLLIIPTYKTANAVFKYDGSAAPSALGGTPPEGMLISIWKAYLVLARSDAAQTRAWFSAENNAQSWNTVDPGGSWVNFSTPLTGIAPLKSVLLFFQEGQTERIRGDNPPPGGDFQREFAFPVGCSDPRSIAYYEDSVIFANPGGIYQSDGASVSNLTKVCGASQYWQTLMAGYVPPMRDVGGTFDHTKISAEVYRDYYIVTVLSRTNTVIDCLVFNLDRKTFFRFSNLPGFGFIRSKVETTEELYLGLIGRRMARLSPMWDPTVNGADANGTKPAFQLETPYYHGGRLGVKRWRDLYLAHDIRWASGSAGLKAEWALTPEATSYIDSDTFPETTEYKRSRIPLRRKSQGLGFKISSRDSVNETPEDVRLYSLEATVEALEGSRRA
jgi:hypothetical protein